MAKSLSVQRDELNDDKWYINIHSSMFLAAKMPGQLFHGINPDFNDDFHLDFLLFNQSTRRTAVWYLNGAAFFGSAFGPSIPAGYDVIAAEDFNQDGAPDCLLYNASTGQSAIFYLNNNALLSTAFGPTIPAGYVLASVGDFDRDGKPRLSALQSRHRWRTAIWLLNNNVFVTGKFGPTASGGFVPIDTADFNVDGNIDILLNPSTRQTAIWY